MLLDAAIRLILGAMASQLAALDPVAEPAALQRLKASRFALDAIRQPDPWVQAPEAPPGLGAGWANRPWLVRVAASPSVVEVVKVYPDGSVLVRVWPAP